jgi:hypothetical protein
MTIVDLNNPSAFHPLRIFSQDRVRNVFTAAPIAPVSAPKRETREELEKIGSEIVMVSSRGTIREADGMQKSVVREVPTPFYKTAGYETLAEFCTEQGEKSLRESQQAAPSAPRSQRVVDEWGAPHPLQSVPPGGKTVLGLAEEKRLLVECDEETALQIANQSSVRTIRLRNRNSKTGETTHVAFIAPAREYPQAALVIANGKSAAVIELMPS